MNVPTAPIRLGQQAGHQVQKPNHTYLPYPMWLQLCVDELVGLPCHKLAPAMVVVVTTPAPAT
jgi:hypothetical protein